MNWKNVGWLVSTAMDRLFYIVCIIDIIRWHEGRITEFWDLTLCQHRVAMSILMLGWVWSLWRNGIQYSVLDYLFDWADAQRDRKAGIRRSNVIYVDRRRDNNDDRIAK